MLTTFLKGLNGHANESGALAAALTQQSAELAAAKADLAGKHERRRALLLDDASDSDLDKIERLIDRASVRVEKLEAAEQPLRERLTAAKAAERRRRWDSLFAAWREAGEDFLAHGRPTMAKHDAVLSIVAQAQREGFAAEAAAHMTATPNLGGRALLAPELLDLFERALASRAVSASVPQPLPPARPKPAPRPTLQHQVSTAAVGVPMSAEEAERLTAKRTPDDTSPLEPGQARVRVARSGFCPTDDSPQAHHGQVLRMNANIAQRAAASGAVEILETTEAPGSSAPAATPSKSAGAAP